MTTATHKREPESEGTIAIGVQEAVHLGLWPVAKPVPERPGEPTWTPADLYGRPLGNRRIMFLELVAWAIEQIEAPRTREAFEAFEQELQRARVENGWGSLPWPRATDPERFLTHVERLAEGFTIGNGEYVARSTD